MSTPTRPPAPLFHPGHAIVAALLVITLGGCATHSVPPPEPESAGSTAAFEPTQTRQRPFTRDALYGLLVAEFALHRGNYLLAMENYLEQAQATRDAGVAARATHLARYFGAEGSTLQAAMLWNDVDPGNAEARFTAATALARAGRSREAFKRMSELAPNAGPSNFTAIAASALELPVEEREQMLDVLQHREEQSADVLIARSLLLHSLQRDDEALEGTTRVLDEDPDNFQALLLSAQIHHDMGEPATGNALFEEALERHPEDHRLRLNYARLLSRSDTAAAERQFRILLEQDPADAEVRLALAQMYHEAGQFDRMREELNTLLEEGNASNVAQFLLAQDAERREDAAEAIRHYLEIRPGSMFMAAETRAAELLVETRGLDAMGKALAAQRARWRIETVPLTLLESELRLEQGDTAGAARLLDAALAAQPDEPPLLYARSLTSERRGDVAALERDLRHMLELDPDNATAMNALGYSLANLTTRYTEALSLIESALTLQPDDPAIIDSMGWVLYRLGRREEALSYLQRAFDAFPDHEVAAHLGEVLWVDGRQDEARRIWRQGLKDRPDSDLIRDTVKRLGADLSQ